MSETITETETKTHYEIIDHNVVNDLYVTYIVDLWRGDPHDPATAISRHIGTWKAEALETEEGNAFDPDFSVADPAEGKSARRYNYGTEPTPKPLVWSCIDITQSADGDAAKTRREHENLVNDGLRNREIRAKGGHVWNDQGERYLNFLEAVDRYAADENDEEAWKVIEAWRARHVRYEERGRK